MKTEKKILIAFLLNLFFSIAEFLGGAFTGSIAILSDAVHDLGDCISIGLSWGLEKKSKKQPDDRYTYGYGRYSVLGSVITTVVLLVGSALVIYHSVERILAPTPVYYDGMIVMGIFGVVVNFAAAYFTHDGDSLNQKAVNLHMLEDVLGWIVVLIGAVVMRFTDFPLLDPILSIATSLFILINAVKNLKEILDIFLVKTPDGLLVSEIREHLMEIDGIEDVHHVHLWTLDGQSNFATVHVVSDADAKTVKAAIREELREHGIGHVTIETERSEEDCGEPECRVEHTENSGHRHHH